MRISYFLISLLFFPASTLAAPPIHPVVIELFTSQGCSSCPPADKLVGSYANRSDVLPLSFHVNYWNYIGWDDPYSSEETTQRQREYQRYLKRRGVYTPQAVVQGTHDVVGSRPYALNKAVAASAKSTPWVPVIINKSDHNMAISIDAAAGINANILLVGYQKQAANHVLKGENAGETLAHTNIVLDIRKMGVYSGAAMQLTHSLPAGDGAAILLQSPQSGQIIGAAWL